MRLADSPEGQDIALAIAGQGRYPDTSLPSDPRIAAFARLTFAIDGADPAEGVAASRELRRLGFHVRLVRPGGSEGSR